MEHIKAEKKDNTSINLKHSDSFIATNHLKYSPTFSLYTVVH